MIPFAEIALALSGAFRLARRDAGGMNDFNPTVTGFWRSFIAALIVAPGYAMVIGPGLASLPAGQAVRATLAETIAYVVTWVAFPLVMIPITERIGRDAAYLRFITAHNWSAVLQMMVLLAAALAGAAMPAGPAAFLHMLAFGLILYYQWFIARTALAVNGATAAGIVGLGVLIELAVSSAATMVGRAPTQALLGQ